MFKVIGVLLLCAGFAHAGVIRDQLTQSNKDVPLPTKSYSQVGDVLKIRWHNQSDSAMAFFAKGSWMQSNEMYLYEPYFKKNNQLLPLIEYTVDLSDYYFSSLSDAYFQLVVENSNSTYLQFIKSRAQVLMADVPQDKRLEAYRNALNDFSGALYSIAISVERSYKKNGQAICSVFDRPSSIFVTWNHYFKDGAPFPGYYDNKQDWVYSKKVLEYQDKKAFMDNVLESFWVGDSSIDFKKRFCP